MLNEPNQRGEFTFERPDLLQIFPSFVWRARLSPDVYRSLNSSLLISLRSLGAPLESLKPAESWQSNPDLHKLEEFSAILPWMNSAVSNVLNYLRVEHQGTQLTGCWANVNAPGATHRLHSHRNNYLSGVYYLQVFEGADTINFYDPRAQAGIIRPPVTALTPENTEQVTLKIEEGMLLLFPAWLQHSVGVNKSHHARVSLSFNSMFSDFTDLARPHWTSGIRITGQ